MALHINLVALAFSSKHPFTTNWSTQAIPILAYAFFLPS